MGSEESMPTSRKIFLLSATALAGHVLALAFHLTIASNVIEFVLVALAAAACFEAARRTAGYAGRFWRLMAVAFVLYALGQAVATYYDSILHASLKTWWPSDVFFIFHVAPMALALFLGDDSEESRVYRWQRWLDFLQIGIVTFSAYLFFLYLPTVAGNAGESSNALYWKVETARGTLLTIAFVLRAGLADSKLVRSLFGRVAIFLAMFTVGGSLYVYLQTWAHLPSGTWYELLWTVPRVFLIWTVATWAAPEQTEPKESPHETLLLAQFAHIAFPLIVLAMAAYAM